MEARHQPTTDYATAQFVREPEAWATIRARGEALRPGMQMSAYEGALLSWLVGLKQAGRVLEIGCFMGLTALWMAKALPPSGTLVTLERDAGYAQEARAHLAIDLRIEVVETDALHWLASDEAAAKGPFDVLFIDGEKKSYAAYLEEAMRLLAPGALIIADNTLLFGAMLGQEGTRASKEAVAAMTRFHEMLADERRFTTTLLPTTEGLTIARKR